MTKKYLAFKEDVAPLAELLAEAFVKSSSCDTLTWDGDTTGLTVVDMGTVDGGTNETKTLAYHVSDAVLTPADIANGMAITAHVKADGSETNVEVQAEHITFEQLSDSVVTVGTDGEHLIFICSEDNYEMEGVVIPKKGTYFLVTNSSYSEIYPISATINGYTGFGVAGNAAELNEEYLPGIVKNAFVESDSVVSSDTITWDCNTDGLETVSVNDRTQAYHVSDAVPTLADIEGRITLIITSTSDNEKQSLTSDLLQVKQLTEKFICIEASGMYLVFVCSEDNCEIDDLVFPKKGIYLCTTVSAVDSNDLIYPSSVTISGYKGFTTTTTAVKLNYDYLPDVVKNAFVESNSGGSDTLTWDGKTDGLLSVEIVEGIKVYHISDATPTEAEMTGNISMVGKRDTYTDGVLTGSEEIAATDFTVFSQGKLTMAAGVNMDVSPELNYTFYVVAEDNVTMNEGGISCTFPKKGIYVIVGQDVNDDGATIIDYPTSIKINGYAGFGCETTVKLNEEYLPDSLTGDILVETTTDTITWDGNTNGLEYASLGSGDPTTIAYHISDAVPTDEDLINGVTSVVFASYSGKKITYDVAFESDDEVIKIGSADTNTVVIICNENNHTYHDITFPKKGIYFIRSEADSGYYYITESLTINGYTGFDTEIKLNEKYLPVIPIAKGGTGATTADGALYNLGLTATTGTTGASKIGFDNTYIKGLFESIVGDPSGVTATNVQSALNSYGDLFAWNALEDKKLWTDIGKLWNDVSNLWKNVGRYKTKDITINNVKCTTKSGSGAYYCTVMSYADLGIEYGNIVSITPLNWTGAAASFTPYLHYSNGINVISDVSQTIGQVGIRVFYLDYSNG